MKTSSPHRLAVPEPRALGPGIAGATLRAVSVAVALACGAGASMAGNATLNITSFSVSAADFSGNFAFVLDDFSFQSYTLSALEAGGLLGAGSDNFSANNWNLGPNRLAQTANTKATGNTVNFTDPATQLTTAGFNLSAQATPVSAPPTQPNSANASGLQQGAFELLDATGAPTGGTLTFDLFYDMSVSTPPNGSPTNFSQTTLSLDRSTDTQATTTFSDGLLSTAFPGGIGSITSGHYSWTYTLAAGEAAYYTLSGSAIASAAVAAVPEPETYALMLLGLAGISAVARRRRTERSDCAAA
jgi:PEP-CTERM motif